jgi:branched-chain amino acid aminotransferase
MPYPMIDEWTGRWVMVQGCLLTADDPAAVGCFEPVDTPMFYEVIRVTRQVPLFWEDHLARLTASAGGQLAIPESLAADGRRLIDANGLPESNLRIVLTPGLTVIHQAPSYYPSAETRRAGIATGILAWERPDPNTKVIRSDYKSAVAARFAASGPFGRYFELLLADRAGFLTEGSRSNLFFIRRHEVLTAPDDRILRGITRQYVRQALEMAGIALRVDMLDLGEIRRGACQAAFLTGSPIDIVPIRAIEDIELPSSGDPDLLRIQAAYGQIVDAYVNARINRAGR